MIETMTRLLKSPSFYYWLSAFLMALACYLAFEFYVSLFVLSVSSFVFFLIMCEKGAPLCEEGKKK
jgi:hypothetical protein